jgi:hypothetical protein
MPLWMNNASHDARGLIAQKREQAEAMLRPR